MGDADLLTHRTAILLVDDHEVVRNGVRWTLEQARDGLYVCGEAGSVAQAIDEIGRVRPDIVLLEPRLQEADGIEAARTIRRRWPATKVVIYTSSVDTEVMWHAVSLGVSAVVLKRIKGHALIDALTVVASGGTFLDPGLDPALVETVDPDSGDHMDKLTPQERRVLSVLADGLTNPEIAASLGLSTKTVRNYVSSILAKLQVSTRTEAAVYLTKRLSSS